jgi:hypothetical protein
MQKIGFFLIVVGMLIILPFAVAADGPFDGSAPLLCANVDIIECRPGSSCKAVTAAEINLPRFLIVNFESKTITTTPETGLNRKTPIMGFTNLDGKVIVHGADDGIEGVRDGMGWTMSIAEKSGHTVLTASGEDVAFIVFGACTLQ